jgi:hypothetical protein
MKRRMAYGQKSVSFFPKGRTFSSVGCSDVLKNTHFGTKVSTES